MKKIFKTVALGVFGLALAGCATTSSTGQYSPTNPNNIRILPVGVTPYCTNYTTVGSVSVSILNAMGTQRSEETINQALRLQAAGLGATAIMNTQVKDNMEAGTAIRCMN